MSRRVADAFARQGVVVVGIGADGWPGVAEEARDALRAAGTVVASPRQLELLPPWLGARRVEWRSPRRGDIRALIEEHASARLVVLAAGDPLVHGIGRTLVEELGAERLLFLPAVSSVALACARLCWPAEDVTVLNAAGRGLEGLPEHVGPGARLIVLSAGRDTPSAVAQRLVELGYGASELVVLGDLGSAREARWEGLAGSWAVEVSSGLNVVGVLCDRGGASRREPAASLVRSMLPGVPPGFASLLARSALVELLAPAAGELIWEIGSQGVLQRACPGRSRLRVESFATAGDLPSDVERAREHPDAALLLGDAVQAEVVAALRPLLAPTGRLVVAAVSLRDSATVVDLHREVGGELLRVALSRAAPLDGAGGADRPEAHWQPGAEMVFWRWQAAVRPAGLASGD